MRKDKLVYLSVIPFVVGYVLNHVIYSYDLRPINFLLYSIAFFVSWFVVGYKSYYRGSNGLSTVVFGNLLGHICFVLILGQILILGRFLPNAFGVYSQLYFICAIPLMSNVIRIFFFWTRNYNSVSIYILSWISMVGVYYLGYRIAKKRNVA